MLDLDNTCVCEECVMMCTELQYEDADEDIVVYGDQGINTEKYEKATYDNIIKTQSEEEEEVQYNVALCANDIVLLEKRGGNLTKQLPMKMYIMFVGVTPH